MLDAALQHPKFAEMFGIPQAMVAEMKEAENDPRVAERYKAMLDAWMEHVAMPAQQQQQGP